MDAHFSAIFLTLFRNIILIILICILIGEFYKETSLFCKIFKYAIPIISNATFCIMWYARQMVGSILYYIRDIFFNYTRHKYPDQLLDINLASGM